MVQVEKLAPGQVGPGTRFRTRFGRGAGSTVIEQVSLDRPRSTISISHSRVLDVEAEGRVTEVPGGGRAEPHARPFALGGRRPPGFVVEPVGLATEELPATRVERGPSPVRYRQ